MIQRVRVGLTGLAVVFLLVLLAAAILGVEEPQQAPQQNVAAVDNASDAPKEPLAELGVTPGGAEEETPSAPAPTDAGR